MKHEYSARSSFSAHTPSDGTAGGRRSPSDGTAGGRTPSDGTAGGR